MLTQNAEIFVIFQSIVFCLKIKSNSKSEFSPYLIQENIAAVAIRNISFSGLGQVVSHWLNSQYLTLTIDQSVIGLILATLYHDESVQTVESGFLKFLHLLSFTNFEEKYLILGPPEDFDSEKLTHFQFDFKTKRAKFPPLTLVSKQDLESRATRDLCETYLVRLVNCARSTLHQINQNLNFDGIIQEKFTISDDGFDAVISLKPFQIPTDSKFGKCENPSVFPIVNYDPVKLFWNEIQESFGNEVQFYFNAKLLKIGLKFKEKAEMKVILEDLQILGKDLIKEVTVKK